MQFIHLHCHSHYSFYNGTASPEKLVLRASELNMPALALTDLCNLYGIPKFYRAATNCGIKPILGMETVVTGYGLTLLAMNKAGWQNLIRLSSLAFLESPHNTPTIDKELLHKHNAGLICLSGFAGGEVGRLLNDDSASGYEKAKVAARWYRDTFGDRYYLELRNHGIEAQTTLYRQTVDIGLELGIETVATNDIHYLYQKDWKIHDILLCIKNGKMVSDDDQPIMGSELHYFRSEADMFAAFGEHREAARRTVEIAERIDPDIFSQFYSKKHNPIFSLPPSKSADDLLRELCLDRLTKRYAGSPLADEAKRRLELELTEIQTINQANYFLIASDIVRFAKGQGIYYTARGSAVGSLVCYALDISHVCPLEFGLLFERFLNETRMTPPDIIIDIEAERRGEIIDYIKEKYGNRNVAQAVLFDKITPCDAIWKVARVLDMPIHGVQYVANGFYDTFSHEAIKGFCEGNEYDIEGKETLYSCYQSKSELAELLDYAKYIEGLPCGFTKREFRYSIGQPLIVSDTLLSEIVPLQRIDLSTDPVLQWEEGDFIPDTLCPINISDQEGMTTISRVVNQIRKTKDIEINPYRLPLNDVKTYALFGRGDVAGVFAVLTGEEKYDGGMREFFQRVKPDNLRDIAATLSLYRPGLLEGGMVDEYIAAKHGKQEVEYPHPFMEEVLHETYGVMVYQEQIIQIMNRLGNIPLANAYFCIKTIAKKKDFSAFREQFIAEAKVNGLAKKRADDIFEKLVMYAPYSFCKAHAIAYAQIAYITAYLKTHYPDEFTTFTI